MTKKTILQRMSSDDSGRDMESYLLENFGQDCFDEDEAADGTYNPFDDEEEK